MVRVWRWYEEDCPEWLAAIIALVCVCMVAMTGVWIILFCYLCRWLFGWHMGIED